MKFRVKLERPGIQRCGEYEAGKEYELEDAALATHLVHVKGFADLGGNVPKPAPKYRVRLERGEPPKDSEYVLCATYVLEDAATATELVYEHGFRDLDGNVPKPTEKEIETDEGASV